MFSFALTDDGLGMSEEELQGLFKPYHQIRPHETQRGQGTGLGLAIARDTIRLHGGDLSCVSKQGEGSTFTVQLPMEVGVGSDLNNEPASQVESKRAESVKSAGSGSGRLSGAGAGRSGTSEGNATSLAVASSMQPVLNALIGLESNLSTGAGIVQDQAAHGLPAYPAADLEGDIDPEFLVVDGESWQSTVFLLMFRPFLTLSAPPPVDSQTRSPTARCSNFSSPSEISSLWWR